MILDVGSGAEGIPHKYLKGENIIHVDIDPTAYHLETSCDIHKLPFQDNSFTTVHASHILEHVANPHLATQELKRVSSKYVIIKVPNAAYLRIRESPDHIYSWNRFTLEHLLRRHFNKVSVSGSQRFVYRCNIVKKILIMIRDQVVMLLSKPPELTAVCEK
jgi:hypothetical protein